MFLSVRGQAVLFFAAFVLVACKDTLYEVVPTTSVTITGMPTEIEAGQTAHLSAQVTSSDGRTLTGRTVTWSTSSSTIATVAPDGRLSALTPGTVTVQATCEGVSGSASTTVKPRPVATVTVSPATATIKVGQLLQLEATPRAADGTPLLDRPVTWSSSNSGVAAVSSGGVVAGVAVGTATITATAEGRSGSAQVTVERTVGSIEVSPTGQRMNVGWRWTFSATVRDTDGVTWAGRSVAWSTSNQAVATVDQTGMVTAAGAGSAEIRATADDVTGSADITISSNPCSAITVWAPQTSVSSSLGAASCSHWAGSGRSEFFGWLLAGQSSVVGTLNATAFRPALAFHKSDATYSSVRYYAHTAAAVGGTSVTNRALLAPGHYLLEANSNDLGTGPYTLGITWGGSHPVITNCIGWWLGPPIDYNGSLAATDCNMGDGSYFDIFLIRLTAQERITVNLSSSQFDAFLLLADQAGNVVAADDDGGGGTNSRLVYTAPARGLYLLLANSFGAGETGSYRLQVETIGGTAGAPALVPGMPATEALELEPPLPRIAPIARVKK